MPSRSLFFDAQIVNGQPDRINTSADLAALITGLATDGVVVGLGGELQVTETNPPRLAVQVATGGAVLAGWYHEEYATPREIEIAPADATNPRIDLIVARRNLDPAVRTTLLDVVPGAPGTTPLAPNPRQDATVWEEALGWVRVEAGATSVGNAKITDRRRWSRARDAARVQGRAILDAAGRILLANAPSVPRAHLYKTTAQSIANATLAGVEHNATRYDSHGMVNLAANAFVATPTIPGVYRIGGAVRWSGLAGGKGLYIVSTIHGIVTRDERPPATMGEAAQTIATERSAAAGEQIYLQVYQTSGGALSVIGAELWLSWVGPS